jgi:hypothetical protein
MILLDANLLLYAYNSSGDRVMARSAGRGYPGSG